jgi:holo-[acyl-carrier protein] synthase
MDIVEINRIQKLLKTFKGKFRDKYFSESEIKYCSSKRKPSQHYAARFAAKEAFFKALGESWPEGCGHRSVEVIVDDSGAPHLSFSQPLESVLANKGMKKAFVSISHTGEYAAAVVIIEG